MEEKSVNNGEKVVNRNPDGTFGDGTIANPSGRPKGALNFTTKFRRFIEKVAEKNGVDPEDIDDEMFAVALKKARSGDYRFYRDIHDRLYGKPVNHTDMTSGGNPIEEVTVRFIDASKKDGNSTS